MASAQPSRASRSGACTCPCRSGRRAARAGRRARGHKAERAGVRMRDEPRRSPGHARQVEERAVERHHGHRVEKLGVAESPFESGASVTPRWPAPAVERDQLPARERKEPRRRSMSGLREPGPAASIAEQTGRNHAGRASGSRPKASCPAALVEPGLEAEEVAEQRQVPT